MIEGKDYCQWKIHLLKSNYDQLVEVRIRERSTAVDPPPNGVPTDEICDFSWNTVIDEARGQAQMRQSICHPVALPEDVLKGDTLERSTKAKSIQNRHLDLPRALPETTQDIDDGQAVAFNHQSSESPLRSFQKTGNETIAFCLYNRHLTVAMGTTRKDPTLAITDNKARSRTVRPSPSAIKIKLNKLLSRFFPFHYFLFWHSLILGV